MELQEDAYRLQQILTDESYMEIVDFLRRKVPFSITDMRCRIALQYFLNKQNDVARLNPNYEEGLRADFLCIKHVLNSVPDDEISDTLRVLGSIPNRKLVATKLLLHKNNNYRKRKKHKSKSDEIAEATSSKLVKVADSTDSNQVVNRVEQSRIPKLVLKRDRNGNEFTVTSPKKENSQSPTPDISISAFGIQPSQESVKVYNKSLKVTPEECLPSSSTYSPDYDAPGPSRQFDDAEAGPSGIRSNDAWRSNLTSISESSSDTIDCPSEDSDGVAAELSADSSPNSIHQVVDEPIIRPADPDLVTLPADESPIILSRKDEKAVATIHKNIFAPNLSIQFLPEADAIIQPADEKLVLKLIEMFPEASSEYIRRICAGKVWSQETFADIVDIILNEDYPRRPERLRSPEKEVDAEEQLCMLKALLPDADPAFLREKIDQFIGDPEGLGKFIEDAVDNKNYPTMKEYLRQQQLSAQQRQYTSEFDVERFVELFPDPVAVFEDPNRKTTIIDDSDKFYVKWFMRNKYNLLYAKDVNNVVDTQGTVNITSIVKALDNCLSKGSLKKTKWCSTSRPDSQNIPLLQELAYFEHKESILKHLEAKAFQAAQEREDAKKMGLLQNCSCCFDEDVMPFDILTCTGGCRFCRVCIRRSTEVAFGEGKVNFPCLSGECDAEFSVQVLQSALPPKLFSKIAQKKAIAEVKAAGIEDLETCPFCDFATIPAPEDKLFRCLNPDCMKESCRLCKETSHVPLRCEEVEKDEAVKARTYIENKMTEALIRECWKCGAKFIKEEGCNKMTCSCGAMMCYFCRQPVKDYKHFNGQGGDRYDLCPLYTDNFAVNEIHVLKAALAAKKDVDPTQLKNDPTADLKIHFGDKIKEAKKKSLEMIKLQKQQQLMRNMGVDFRRELMAAMQYRRQQNRAALTPHIFTDHMGPPARRYADNRRPFPPLQPIPNFEIVPEQDYQPIDPHPLER